MDNSLYKFGGFIIKHLFDKGFYKFIRLKKGEFNAPSLLDLQTDLKKFNDNEIDIIQTLVLEIMTSSMHDFLFAIQEFEDDIKINVNNENVAKLSDGLHGEIFTDDGWIKKYSDFKKLYKEE